MHNFNQKCPNTLNNTPQLYTTDALFSKMFQYLYIVYYRSTLQQNVSIHLYCIILTRTFTTLQ